MPTELVQNHIDTAIDMALRYSVRAVFAIIVLVVGLWIIKRVVNLTARTLQRSSVDPTLARFSRSLVSIGLKALLLISVAAMIGIQTTSFVAVVGAAGLAIGLALQGSLANFAGGVLVLLFRPYEVGDFIEAQDVSGTVKQIQIFSTILNTPDNKIIIVPNAAISNGIITNYSRESTRRVDFVFGIGYGDDIGKAKAVLERLVQEDKRILAEPEHLIVVSELADSSVNITLRAWVQSEHYWPVYFELVENVKLAFDRDGISIPFPQRDVHVYQAS